MTRDESDSFHNIAAALKLSNIPDAWATDWHLSAAPAPERATFLDAQRIEEITRNVNMGTEAARALHRAAASIHTNPALERLAWHCHWMAFHSGVDQIQASTQWPVMPETLGEAGRLFYAVVMLSGLPALEKMHTKRAIPADVTRDTLMDVEVWMNDYHQKHGSWGFGAKPWLMNHCQAKLYRLGRLQFELSSYSDSFLVLHHKQNGMTRVLAPGDARVDEHGQFAEEGAPGWTTVLTRHNGVIRGHPVSARSEVQREAIELRESEWATAMNPGDAILSVHIPAIGPMTHESCGESFARAMAFFPRHFPEHNFRAFMSSSWIFDPQLEDLLPGESNLVRFLREFQLLPIKGTGDWQTFERVFGGPVKDLDAAPRDTTLRRAVIRHAKAGGKWRVTGMLMLREDLDWGACVYRRGEPRR